MAESQTASPIVETLYCTVHPTVETSLRCNKCGRPMCIKCARRTPVGYRCRECVKGQQQVFYSSKGLDPVIQGAVSLVLSALAAALIGVICGRLGLIWGSLIALSAGSAAGALIGDMAHRAAGRRRGKYSWLIVAGGIVVGGLIALPAALFLGDVLPWGIYIFTATSAAVGRLRFGRV
jgi:hypothetical protein